uniref:Uncharacterized protein n=1 Tax=Arundo donax TaxID=35708 RepID=A0A0A8Z1N3_ARUDO
MTLVSSNFELTNIKYIKLEGIFFFVKTKSRSGISLNQCIIFDDLSSASGVCIV